MGTRTRQRSEVGLVGLLVLLCLALALVLASNSALAIALADLASALGATQAQLTWIIDAYAVVFAALLLPAGIAADRVGRRRMLAAGLMIFGVASVVSAFATTPDAVIVARAVAGVGAAAVFPITLSALVDAYPQERRPFAVAVWSGVSAAGAVVGTLVAGALLEFAWWGSIQLTFGAAALAAVPFALRMVPDYRDRTLSPDIPGSLLSLAGLATLVFAVIEAPVRGLTDPLVLASAATGALALAAFARTQLRSRAPSLDVRLFRTEPALLAGSLVVTLQFLASIALFVVSPQYLQLVRGYSPLGSAIVLLAIGVGVGPATALSTRLMSRLGAATTAVIGMLVMAAGAAATAAVIATAGSMPALLATFALFGAGFGLGLTPGTSLILDTLPAARRSVASAVNDLTREVGGVIGIAALSSVLLSAYRGALEQINPPLRPALLAAAQSGPQAGLAAAGPDTAPTVATILDSFSTGFAVAVAVGAAILLLGAVLAAAITRRAPRTRSANA